jgi:biopolymer transport protein ExbB/TolQ
LLTVIPLTGFVGTVLGIGNAVRSFTDVLGGSQGTEELVQALGGVTAGLGTAFDTTFLALVLSVPFLIFLTVVEQRETRLLQSVDTAISENLISRLDQGQGESAPVTEASFREGIEEAVEELGTQVHSAVQTGFEEYIPRPEVLVEPAQRYAEQAAHSLAEQFVSEVSTVQNTTSQLMERLEQITETSAQRRQEFLDAVSQQQRQNQASLQSIIGEVRSSSSEFLDAVNQQQQRNQESLQSIISEVRNSSGELVQQMQESGNEVSRGLQSQAQQLAEQLDRALERTTSSLSTVSEDLQTQARQISQELAEAANALNQRVTSLEQYAAQVSEVQELERTLNQTLETLSSSQQLQNTLTELQRTLEQLQPIIEKAQRPRRLRVVEEEED